MSDPVRAPRVLYFSKPDFFNGLRVPLAAILLLALVLALSAQAAAQGETNRTIRAGSLTIEEPWTRATPGGAKVAGGYLRITNTGSASDRLVGGSSTVAGRFEIHEMSVSDGVMRMRPLKDGLEIKPGETVELKPGGYHVMFMDLKQPLKEGETVKGTLVFEKAGTVAVEYRVGPIGASTHGRGGHETKGHAPMGGHKGH